MIRTSHDSIRSTVPRGISGPSYISPPHLNYAFNCPLLCSTPHTTINLSYVESANNCECADFARQCDSTTAVSDCDCGIEWSGLVAPPSGRCSSSWSEATSWTQGEISSWKYGPASQVGCAFDVHRMGRGLWYVSRNTAAFNRVDLRTVFIGPVYYFRVFNKGTLVINSVKTALDLLDARASRYSDRPIPRMATLGGRGLVIFTMSQFHPRFKTLRKLLSAGLTKSCTRTYRPIKERECITLLQGLLKTPEMFQHHIRRCGSAFSSVL